MISFFDWSSEDRRKQSREQLKAKNIITYGTNLNLIDTTINPKVQVPLDLRKFGELLDMENLTSSTTPIGYEESTTTAASTSNATNQSVIT